MESGELKFPITNDNIKAIMVVSILKLIGKISKTIFELLNIKST